MKTLYKTILIFITSSLIIAGCKKEKSEPKDKTTPSSNSGDLALHVNFKGSSAPFSTDSVYQDDFGNNYKFTLVKIYLGNIGLEDNGSNLTYADERFVLLDPSTMHYDLGKVEASTYPNLVFNIGMDSTTNHSDPNTYPATSPLYPQSPSMHWSWSSGYIFYKLEGVADTNNDMTFESNFSFHVGTDGLTRAQSLNVSADIQKDQSNMIMLNVDVTKFLTNVNLDTEYMSHTMGTMPLATKIADNGNAVFTTP